MIERQSGLETEEDAQRSQDPEDELNIRDASPARAAGLKHLRAIVALPVMMAGVVPALLLSAFGGDSFGLWGRLPGSWSVMLIVGGVLGAVGLVLVISTNWLFATRGRGTLAFWDPTQELVVEGVYRHVRNPMISGVFCILLGEAIAAASLPLLIWFAVFVIGNLIWIPLREEPELSARFGQPYETYKCNVPRWMPRIKPWRPASRN